MAAAASTYSNVGWYWQLDWLEGTMPRDRDDRFGVHGEVVKGVTRGQPIVGTWEIVSSADFDDEYLNEQGTPYVQLQKDGDRIVGEYHLGLQNGSVAGRPQSD